MRSIYAKEERKSKEKRISFLLQWRAILLDSSHRSSRACQPNNSKGTCPKYLGANRLPELWPLAYRAWQFTL